MKVKRKKCQVIMLPTEERKNGNICISPNIKGKTELKIITNDKASLINEVKPQHLYITSDDEIKEGDWVYSIRGFVGKFGEFENNYKKECKKIISSTDKSLTIQHQTSQGNLYDQPLPKPSKAFIQKYCELGGINEVMVEYIMTKGNIITLKVNSHNEITIHPIKDSWSREEVESLLFQYAEYWGINSKQDIEEHNQWVKENL